MGNEDREALYNFSRTRDVDIAVEIGKGVIDTASLVTGILLTGPAGVFVGLGIDSLAIGICIEHGDDEEAVMRTIGVIAGAGLGAVSKYADEVADLGDDVLGSVYKNSLDDVSDFKGFNLDENSVFFKNADDVAEGGLDVNLLDEMANSGAKYNPDDIVAITKTADGKLVWLENGTDTAGLNHIITEHADDFYIKE